MRSHRDAARHDHDIGGLERLAKRGARALRRVRHGAAAGQRAARALDLRREREAVRAVDPARGERLAGRGELVAGDEDEDARALGAAERGAADRRRDAQLGWAQHGAALQNDSTEGDVLARPADVGARARLPAPSRDSVALSVVYQRKPRPSRARHPSPLSFAPQAPRRPRPPAPPPRSRSASPCPAAPPPRPGVPRAPRRSPRAPPRARRSARTRPLPELSKGGTSMPLVTSSASTRPSARSSGTSSSPGGSQHRAPGRGRRRSRSGRSRAQSCPNSAPVRRLRGYDPAQMTSIRGPLARLDRSRDELAKAWLVRLIERASLDEIRELPTERIARELPELIGDIVREAWEGEGDPYDLSKEQAERAASLATLRGGGREVQAADVARDLAALQSVLVHALREEIGETEPGAIRRGGRAPRRGHRRHPGGGDGGARADALARARVAGEHRSAHRPRQSARAPAPARDPARGPQALPPPVRPAADGHRRAQADQRLARPPGRRPRADAGGDVAAPLDPVGGHRRANRRRRVLRAASPAGPEERRQARGPPRDRR